VIRHVAEREATQVRTIPHLQRKIEDLNMSFIDLFVVQPPLFYSILDFNQHLIHFLKKKKKPTLDTS
jgi:hypothetical protein